MLFHLSYVKRDDRVRQGFFHCFRMLVNIDIQNGIIKEVTPGELNTNEKVFEEVTNYLIGTSIKDGVVSKISDFFYVVLDNCSEKEEVRDATYETDLIRIQKQLLSSLNSDVNFEIETLENIKKGIYNF